jgi:hypothetical protein
MLGVVEVLTKLVVDFPVVDSENRCTHDNYKTACTKYDNNSRWIYYNRNVKHFRSKQYTAISYW